MSNLVVDPQTLMALKLALKSTLAKVQEENRTTINFMRQALVGVDVAVKTRKARVEQSKTLLETCRRSDRDSCFAEESALAEAQLRLAAALSAQKLASQAAADFELQARSSLNKLEELQAEGQRYLSFKLDRVNEVNAAGAGRSRPRIDVGGLASSGGTAEEPRVHSLRGLPAGFVMVPLDLIDQTDNPIKGIQDFGKGYTIEDLDYAFELLEGHILPGLANGSNASVFAATDQANGSYGTRSLSDTLSGFFGGDGIRLELRPDGRYGINNGRHRIFVASHFGRKYVPARLIGGPT